MRLQTRLHPISRSPLPKDACAARASCRNRLTELFSQPRRPTSPCRRLPSSSGEAWLPPSIRVRRRSSLYRGHYAVAARGFDDSRRIRLPDTLLSPLSPRNLFAPAQSKRFFNLTLYFGDGAGALLLEASTTPSLPWIHHGVLNADGRGSELIRIPAGGSKLRVTAENLKQSYFQMNGKAVFGFRYSSRGGSHREIVPKMQSSREVCSARFSCTKPISIYYC